MSREVHIRVVAVCIHCQLPLLEWRSGEKAGETWTSRLGEAPDCEHEAVPPPPRTEDRHTVRYIFGSEVVAEPPPQLSIMFGDGSVSVSWWPTPYDGEIVPDHPPVDLGKFVSDIRFTTRPSDQTWRVQPTSPPTMTVVVDAWYELTVRPSHPVYHRTDIVTEKALPNSNRLLQIWHGTPSGWPVRPLVPADVTVLAVVHVPASQTYIVHSNIGTPRGAR